MAGFSENLKKLRLEKNMIQADVSEYLGISIQSYSAYENGREPNYDILAKLAIYFGVSTDYLIGLSNTKCPEYADICRTTGLNEYSVSKLEETMLLCSNFQDEKALLKVFNALISNNLFFEFLSLLTAYVYPESEWAKKYETYHTETLKPPHAKTKEEFRATHIAFLVSSFFSHLLERMKEAEND